MKSRSSPLCSLLGSRWLYTRMTTGCTSPSDWQIAAYLVLYQNTSIYHRLWPHVDLKQVIHKSHHWHQFSSWCYDTRIWSTLYTPSRSGRGGGGSLLHQCYAITDLSFLFLYKHCTFIPDLKFSSPLNSNFKSQVQFAIHGRCRTLFAVLWWQYIWYPGHQWYYEFKFSLFLGYLFLSTCSSFYNS